jgi:hypothetical protein
MLLAVLLIPALIAMAMLNSMSAPRVLLRVYVPCLIYIPVHLTSVVGGYRLTDTAPLIMLLCGVGLVRWYQSLKFTFVDACILLFAFSAFYADAHQRGLNIAFYALCDNLAACTFPYFVGRTLIEQTGSRRELAKSLVFCLAILGVFSLYEYRMEANVFNVLEAKISGGTPSWGLATRWGFARIAGPYGSSITAAMIFSTGLLLQLWLAGTRSWEGSKALRFFRTSRRAKAITLGVLLGLFLTQSRGPWIGCAFGLAVASIGFAKNRKRAATFTLAGLLIALVATGIFLKSYAFDHKYEAGGDQNQQNATYRAELIPTYMPLIAKGGIWGWGTPTVVFGRQAGWVAGLTSIDNEYIRIAMAQGYAGAVLFVLILVASIWRAARFCATFRERQDIMFAYCMLGALLALAFTLTTVALLDPMMQLAFLLFGWTQSLRPTGNQQKVLAPVATAPYSFKRVFA